MSNKNLHRMNILFCGFAIFFLAGCGMTSAAAPPDKSIKDQASFIDALRARGYTVEKTEPIDQPFLQVEGTGLRVSGGNFKQPAELQSFDYDDKELGADGLKAAADDASQIEPSGDPRTMRISWIAPPHFYRTERLIVLYLGSDPTVLALLKELLGPQFAGQ